MRLSGSITALATPFTSAGALDPDAWRRLLRRQLDAGTAAVVVAGSTGEAAALELGEYEILLRTAVEVVAGRMPVLAGTGLSNTAKTVAATRRAAALGADTALVVAPPYVCPTQAGLLAHYRAVADDGALPLVLYNVPSRTGCDLLPETVAELATHPRIVGIKEARSDPGRMQALLALRDVHFAVLGGDDASAAHALLAGADGVVSVASNVVPAAFHRLCALTRAGDRVAIQALDARLQALYAFLVVEPNPIPVKALLSALGIGEGIRLPLTPLTTPHAAQVAELAAHVTHLELSCRDMLAA